MQGRIRAARMEVAARIVRRRQRAPACASRRSRRRTRRLPHVRRAARSPAPRSRSGTFGRSVPGYPTRRKSPARLVYCIRLGRRCRGRRGMGDRPEVTVVGAGDRRGHDRLASSPARLPRHPRGPVGARALPRQLLGLHPHPPRDPRQRRAVHPLGAGSPAPLAGAASGARLHPVRGVRRPGARRGRPYRVGGLDVPDLRAPRSPPFPVSTSTRSASVSRNSGAPTSLTASTNPSPGCSWRGARWCGRRSCSRGRAVSCGAEG